MDLTDQDLRKIFRDLRRFQRRKDEAAEDIEQLHEQLKAYMKERSLVEFVHSGYKVTWKPVESVQVNTKALREVAPELVARFSVPVMTLRFKVTAAPVDKHH